MARQRDIARCRQGRAEAVAGASRGPRLVKRTEAASQREEVSGLARIAVLKRG